MYVAVLTGGGNVYSAFNRWAFNQALLCCLPSLLSSAKSKRTPQLSDRRKPKIRKPRRDIRHATYKSDETIFGEKMRVKVRDKTFNPTTK